MKINIKVMMAIAMIIYDNDNGCGNDDIKMMMKMVMVMVMMVIMMVVVIIMTILR